jgi:hypothetical protein
MAMHPSLTLDALGWMLAAAGASQQMVWFRVGK